MCPSINIPKREKPDNDFSHVKTVTYTMLRDKKFHNEFIKELENYNTIIVIQQNSIKKEWDPEYKKLIEFDNITTTLYKVRDNIYSCRNKNIIDNLKEYDKEMYLKYKVSDYSIQVTIDEFLNISYIDEIGYYIDIVFIY